MKGHPVRDRPGDHCLVGLIAGDWKPGTRSTSGYPALLVRISYRSGGSPGSRSWRPAHPVSKARRANRTAAADDSSAQMAYRRAAKAHVGAWHYPAREHNWFNKLGALHRCADSVRPLHDPREPAINHYWLPCPLVRAYVVGATGFEPPSSSVSANSGEALCGSPFPQVTANRR